MATQKHLNCKRESCPLLAKKCSPHVFVICLKFLTCHEWALLTAFPVDSRTCRWLLNINI
jgi:hypothetical protein